MALEDRAQANRETQNAWNRNAAFWDDHMGEGNAFVETLIWPATQRLLPMMPGQRVLDAGCGNGLYARKLAALGAEVVAFDFAEEMIRRARARGVPPEGSITYHVIDATDEAAMLGLGEGQFAAVISQMALFDMAEIDPLMRAVARLLRPPEPASGDPGGHFVFSVIHPCFNQGGATLIAESVNREGRPVTVHGVKVTSYLSPAMAHDVALQDQPQVQVVFHRPLAMLLGAGFRAGLVLDGLEEQAFPADHPKKGALLSWNGAFSEIPPVLVASMRRGK